jgi:hypothetical protein
MEIAQIYAIAVAGFSLALMALNCRSAIKQFWKHAAYLGSKYLTYPHLVRRHRLLRLSIGPWTPSEILTRVVYASVNLFCLCFRTSSMTTADVRARNLALINLVPVSAGPHLSFLADLLGISLSAYKLLHRSAGLMSFALMLFHVLNAVSHHLSFSLADPAHFFGLVVSRFPPWPRR